MGNENNKTVSLLQKTMKQFICCIAVLFALAAPAFYYLTKNYYAEDMEKLVRYVQAGKGIPAFDLEEDTMQGIMLQYILITALLGIGVVLTMRFVSQKLWTPFDQTLKNIDSFQLEKNVVPDLPQSDIKEFKQLNDALTKLMSKNIESYKSQKEFTENASHELQTPLAIFQAKLELLMQQPKLTGEQAEIIQDLFQMTFRLSHLNRNLLLLAKIDNKQFDTKVPVCIGHFIDSLLPSLESISGELHIKRVYSEKPVYIEANSTLLESMISNLIVNAVRHSSPDGTITIRIDSNSLAISNTSDEPAISTSHIFNRFYRPAQSKGGNGLGLAIVKAICDYHGWNIEYKFKSGLHSFNVNFKKISE